MPTRESPVVNRPRPDEAPGDRRRSRLLMVSAVVIVVGAAALILSQRDPDPGTADAPPATQGQAIPADVTVVGTTGLVDGSEVKVKVVAHADSQVFGYEAFLCMSGATFDIDSDIRPTRTGKCLSKPLSAGSDRYQEVRGAPPYAVAESTFRAGVGTDTYSMGDGRQITITCGPGHPCQLVLKIQYPDGFGFRAYDLKYR